MRKILVVLSILLAIGGIYLIEVHFAEAYELEIEKARQEADLIEAEISMSFEQVESDLFALYSDSDLVTYLNDVNTKADVKTHNNYDYVVDMLKSKAEQGYVFAWIANDRANFFLDSTDFMSHDGYDPKKRPWYQAIETDDIYYTDVYVDVGTGEKLMTAIKVVDEVPYSFICLDFSISQIINRFEEEVYVIDENGMIIYSKYEENIGSSIVDLGYLTDEILSSDEGTYEKDGTITFMYQVNPMRHKFVIHKDLSHIRDKQITNKIIMQTGCIGLVLFVIIIIVFLKREKKELEE